LRSLIVKCHTQSVHNSTHHFSIRLNSTEWCGEMRCSQPTAVTADNRLQSVVCRYMSWQWQLWCTAVQSSHGHLPSSWMDDDNGCCQCQVMWHYAWGGEGTAKPRRYRIGYIGHRSMKTVAITVIMVDCFHR